MDPTHPVTWVENADGGQLAEIDYNDETSQIVNSFSCTWQSNTAAANDVHMLCTDVANAADSKFGTWFTAKDAAAMARWRSGSSTGDDKSSRCKMQFGKVYASFELAGTDTGWSKTITLTQSEDGSAPLHC